MKELAEFIVSNIIPKGKFDISENVEDGHVQISIKADTAVIGLLIGKAGNTIKAIQTLLRVKGRLEDKLVNVDVSEIQTP
jgi:predicted RNA-binding protein YlqC (UPF0109 family)